MGKRFKTLYLSELSRTLFSSGADVTTLRSNVSMNGKVIRLTAFELALERSDKVAELVYNEYDKMSVQRRNREHGSFLLAYLSSGRVSVHAIDTLVRFGENINYEVNGENCFTTLLKDYSEQNLVEVVCYMLNHVSLSDQEVKLRERICSLTSRCFPSLFDSRTFNSKRNSSINCSRKGYNSIGVVLKYCRRTNDRMRLVNILLKQGSNLDHLTTKGRSILHLAIKSHYSSLNEIKYLVDHGIKIKWTDIRQAIKYKKISLLNYLLTNSDPIELNLKQNLPKAMSMLVLKTKPGDYPPGHPTITWFLATFMNDHGLNPVPPPNKRHHKVDYPIPLLFLLIFKNKLYHAAENADGSSFYGEAIKLIATDDQIDLDYRSDSHGTALTYATKLDQPREVINLLFPGNNRFKTATDGTDGQLKRKNSALGNQSTRVCLGGAQVACHGDGYRCLHHPCPENNVPTTNYCPMSPVGREPEPEPDQEYLTMAINANKTDLKD